MLSARATLKAEYEKLHKIVLAIVREDAVCRRLMTVPSVGPIVAITYKSAMDDPNRIAKSKAAGALFGLTPKKYQSGEKDVTGGITRTGAHNPVLETQTLGNGRRQAARFETGEGARKIAVILHRMARPGRQCGNISQCPGSGRNGGPLTRSSRTQATGVGE